MSVRPREVPSRTLGTLLAASLLVAAVPAWAGAFRSSDRSVRSLDRVERKVMPRVDVARLLAEDEANRRVKDLPHRVGHRMPADLSPSNSGTWEDDPDGGRTWRLRVHSENARWIVLGFGTFGLAPGAELRVYDPERENELGPFGAESVRDHGQLWLPPLPSDTLVLELRWPEELRGRLPNLQLGTVVHGYKDAWGSDLGTPEAPPPEESSPAIAGTCNVDVRCPAGDEHEDQARGVVQLLSGGFAFCTGSLVNTTANDCRPYVLTAAHCIDSVAEAISTTFRFEYERPLCEVGAAPWDRVVTGSTLLATYAASDFTLLAIDGELPENVEPFFNGWSRSSAPAQESWGIHHPSGDVKKISYNADAVIHGKISGWGVDHWRVTDWELGTTESGSSGSPLFDEHGRIVGQLHGGLASCEDETWDEYGKLFVSWTGGATPDSRLADWLDPRGSGVVTLDGISADVCSGQPSAPCVDGFRVLELSGNGDGRPDPGETFDLEIDRCNETEETELVIASPTARREERPRGFRPRFTLRLDRSHPCGEPLVLEVRNGGAEGGGAGTRIEVPTGSPSISEPFRESTDADSRAWTVASTRDGWFRTADTWRVRNSSDAKDASLTLSIPSPIPQGARLRFDHRFDTENVRDGGVLEYSIDGGATWNDAEDLISEGGYNSGIGSEEHSPLAGRRAWAGDSGGWRSVEVDLGPLHGADLSLRWRFASNGSIGDDGWLLGDVTVETTSHACRSAPGPRAAGGSRRPTRSGL